MNESILCLVAFSFLAWVVVLKMQNNELQEENRKLRSELEHFAKKMKGDVDVMQGSHSWGKGKDDHTHSEHRHE